MVRIPTLILVLVPVLVEGSRLLPKLKLCRPDAYGLDCRTMFSSSVFTFLSLTFWKGDDRMLGTQSVLLKFCPDSISQSLPSVRGGGVWLSALFDLPPFPLRLRARGGTIAVTVDFDFGADRHVDAGDLCHSYHLHIIIVLIFPST